MCSYTFAALTPGLSVTLRFPRFSTGSPATGAKPKHFLHAQCNTDQRTSISFHTLITGVLQAVLVCSCQLRSSTSNILLTSRYLTKNGAAALGETGSVTLHHSIIQKHRSPPGTRNLATLSPPSPILLINNNILTACLTAVSQCGGLFGASGGCSHFLIPAQGSREGGFRGERSWEVLLFSLELRDLMCSIV